ncbi:MAG: zinc-binding dehydrogenase [Planctomycetota bacterium]
MKNQSIDRQTIERMVREAIQGDRPATPSSGVGRVAMLVEKQQIELRAYPIPQIAEDEILVRVEACGICGTDIHCYLHDPFGLAPHVLGHEGTGEVIEIGSKWKIDSVGKEIKVGDHVVTSVLGTSEQCGVARYNPLKANLCDDLRVYGLLPDSSTHHFNGYFGEYLVIRPGSSVFVVNGMSEDLRVLIEPAAVVCHALERAKTHGSALNFRTRVVVQGCGPIGLMMIAVLRTFGVNNIIAIDGNDHRLDFAARVGADHRLNYKNFSTADDLADAVAGLTKGLGAHFGFQTTGVPQAAANMFKYIRRGGSICEIGHFVDGGSASINPHEDFCKKEITLLGSWAYNSWEYPNAYHFLQRAESAGLPVSDLVTHRFPLHMIQEAFDLNLRQEGVKIVVQTPDA